MQDSGLRVIRLFLSSPGDLETEKDHLNEVAREVSSLFRNHGVSLEVWRHEIDGQPSPGQDPQDALNRQIPPYDIYCGMMCRRLGTPTPRDLSGTVEEFRAARQSWEETGRPRVLFYFRKNPQVPANDEEAAAQLQAVQEFQAKFPGYFATFDDSRHLRRMFRNHLIREVLDIRFPPERSLAETVDRRRGWVTTFRSEIDRLAGAQPRGFFDWSSDKPARIVGKLESLLDLDTLLDGQEREILTAGAYYRVLRVLDRQATPEAQREKLAERLGGSAEFASAVQRTVEQVDSGVKPQPQPDRSESPRCDLLAALLTVGEFLDRDHAGIAPASIGHGPHAEADPRDWVAWLTPEIRVERFGVVHFGQIAPSMDWYEPIKRYTTYCFELLWQSLRQTFTRHGVALATAPCQVTISEGWPEPPPGVLERLKQAVREAAAGLAPLEHLGDEEPIEVEDLVPLPHSAIAGRTAIRLDPSDDHALLLWNIDRPHDPQPQPRQIPAGGESKVVVDPAELEPGTKYGWRLDRSYGIGKPDTIASGIVQTLSPKEAQLLKLTRPRDGEGLDRNVQIELGLWNDVLADLWPRLDEPATTFQQRALAYRLLLAAYDWVREHDPGSPRVDLYREAGWQAQKLLVPEENEP